MSDKQISKSRRSFILVIAVFVVPVVLAKLALDNQWFNYGVTNHGELVDNQLTLTDLGLENKDFEDKWLMLYNVPQDCDVNCQEALKSVDSTYVLLGKYMPRVTPVALTSKELSPEQLAQIRTSMWQVIPMPEKAKKRLVETQVVIVDPLKNIVLSHQMPKDKEALDQLSKAILADMKKLLKYSRIG